MSTSGRLSGGLYLQIDEVIAHKDALFGIEPADLSTAKPDDLLGVAFRPVGG
jgi:hypothetical protein